MSQTVAPVPEAHGEQQERHESGEAVGRPETERALDAQAARRESQQRVDDVSKLPFVTSELLRRGFSESDVRKILGENVLRVLAASEH